MAYISTAAVADALGVSVSTVKRWIDQGVLPATRTAGGHRRLDAADVLRAVEERSLPHRDLSVLGDPAAAQSPGQASRQLLDALNAGDANATRRLVLQTHESGMPIATLADQIVAPAMRAIGHDWETGAIDVLHEHRATMLCAAALCELKARVGAHPRRVAAVAVGGSVEGDPYLLPNLLIETVLLEAGWHVVNMGPNTPLRSFAKAITQFRPQLVWVSLSHLADVAPFEREYADLARYAARRETAIAIGGRALDGELRARLPYTMFGDGLTQFASFVRGLGNARRKS